MKALHVGRSWPGMGNPLEATCPCPKEPCGLVALDRANPNCLQHPVNRIKTMRQIHEADMCPGISVQTVEQERDEARAEVERLRELNAAAERARQDALPFVNAAPALILEVERLRSQLAVQTLKEIEDTKKVMPKLAPHITDTYGKYTLDVYDLVVNSQDCRIVIRVGDDVKYEMKYPAYKVWTFIAHWKELAEVADAHDDDAQDESSKELCTELIQILTNLLDNLDGISDEMTLREIKNAEQARQALDLARKISDSHEEQK